MPARPHLRTNSICQTCRHTLRHRTRIRPFSHSARTPSSPTTSTPTSNSKPDDIDDYYALILNHPLPTSTVTQRPLHPSLPPVPSAPPASPPTTSNTQPQASSVAARAKLVFGTHESEPEKRAKRKLARDAQATVVAGVRIPPRPAEPDNCCMSGCVNCVWDLYREELEEWAERKQEAQMKMHGGGAAEKGRQLVTGGGMGEAALSMDDDGGGSETNWDPLEEGARVVAREKESGEGLFTGVPVGIREFMKTEKRLGRRRAERERAAGNA